MPSRVESIRILVEVHVAAAVAGVTISNKMEALDQVDLEDLPWARVLFIESDPERLDFKQETRTVTGQILLAFHMGDPVNEAAARETCDAALQAIRDAIFGDDDLSDTVDYAIATGTIVVSGAESHIVYGTIDVETEEIF